MNSFTWQLIIVAIIVAIAIIYSIIRGVRSRKSGPGCGCGCSGCSLRKECPQPEKKSEDV